MSFARYFLTRPAHAYTLLALLLSLLLWGQAGRGWDDGLDEAYGEAVWKYYASGLKTWEVPPSDGGIMKHYGPLSGLLSSAWHHLGGLPPHAQRPWVISWYWVACFAPVVAAATRLGGSTACGWMAGLALLAMPRFLGEAFVNAKDLPLACGIAWSVWAAIWLAGKESARPQHYAVTGLSVALALAARPAALFAFGPLFICLCWRTLNHRNELTTVRSLLHEVLGGLLAAGVALGTVSLLWPTALESGLHAWIDTIKLAQSFSVAYPVLYQGTLIPSDKLPWHYPFVYFAITTPLPLLVFFLGGFAAGFARLNRWKCPNWPGHAALVTLILFPFVLFVVARPNIYDGIRHFLFLTPLAAIVVGSGYSLLQTSTRATKPIGLFITIALLAWGLVPTMRMHPYSLAYFNPLAGSPGNVHERYETDYWVLSYRDAAEWINARQRVAHRPICVAVAANAICITSFNTWLDPKVKVAFALVNSPQGEIPPPFDYYVATVRYGQAANFADSPIVQKISRADILLSVIRGRPNAESP